MMSGFTGVRERLANEASRLWDQFFPRRVAPMTEASVPHQPQGPRALLTEQEQEEALQAAADQKQQRLAEEAIQAERVALAALDQEIVRARRRDRPTAYIGLDSGSGEVSYIEEPSGRERLVFFAGQTYEHVDTDRDGVWIYRRVR